MMTRFFKTLALAIVLLTFSAKSYASHVMGADITYVCLGNNTYEFTLVVYRDCESTTFETSYDLAFTSATCGQNFTVTMPQIGVETEVSAVCSTSVNQTTCNGGTIPGTEEWIYRSQVTFPAECNDWIISWNICCRNAAITNLTSPDTRDIYVQVTLDNTNGLCNNSPQYAALPVPYICANQLFTYNHGAWDVDGDSLVYELTQPLEGTVPPGTPIPYSAGYTVNDPVITSSGFNFNPLTGEMCFIPSQQQQSVVSVLIYEYRNGVLIATHIREMQVVVSSVCTNINPTIGTGGCSNIGGITNLQGGPSVMQVDSNVITMCPDDNVCFDMVGFDSNFDNITMTSNLGVVIPGATITVDSNGVTSTPVATFCWIPTAADTGVHAFTLTLTDDACPIAGTSNFAYLVNVWTATSAGPDRTICGPNSEFPGQTQLNAIGGTEFVWSVISGDPMVEGVNFSCDSCPNPVATPSITTTYEVVSNLAAGCKYRDTVVVFVVPDFSFTMSQSADSICLFDNAQFVVTPSPAGAYTYEWFGQCAFNYDTVANPIGTFDNAGAQQVYFDIISPDGCLKSDTFDIVVSSAIKPNITILADTSLCIGDSVQFVLENNSAFSNCNYTLNMTDLFGDGWNGASFDFFQNGTLVGSYTIANGSSGTATIPVTHGASVSVNFTSGSWASEEQFTLLDADGNIILQEGPNAPNGTIYTGTVTCPGAGFSTQTFAWTPSLYLDDATIQNPMAGPVTDTTFTVIVTDTIGGCSDTASVMVHIVPSFNFTAVQSDTVVCLLEQTTITVTPDPGTYTYDWSSQVEIADTTANPVTITHDIPGTNVITLAISNTAGCTRYDSFEVLVSTGATPAAYIKGDTTLCQGDFTQLEVLSATAGMSFLDDFDPAQDNNLWSAITGATPSTSCGSVSGNGLFFDGNGNREAVTVDMSLPTGGTITFSLKIAATGSLAPCEASDAGEDVVLEYSTNAGTNWTLMNTYSVLAFPNFTTVTEQVPAGAQTLSTRFRWRQLTSSGTGFDNWAMDNVSITGTSGTYAYTWTPSTGLSDPSVYNPVVNVNTDQTYTVTMIDTLGGCQDQVSVTVHVVPAFTFNVTQADDTVCLNEQVQFTATPTPTGTYTYSWTSSGILNSNSISNPTATFTTPGNVYSYVQVTSPGGCDKYDSVLVVVSPGQQPNLQISANSPICAGESTTLTVSNINGASTATYAFQWTPATGLSAPTAGVTNCSPSATTTYTVVATDTIGQCTGSKAITITVNPIPNAVITTTEPDFCVTESAFTFAGTPVTGQWSGPGITNTGIFNPSTAGTGTHTLTFTVTQNGCSATQTTSTAVYPTPAAPTMSADPKYCAGEWVNNVTATGSGSGTIQWFDHNGNSISAPTGFSAVQDTLYAQEVNSAGCVGPQSSIVINVVPKPNVGISANPSSGNFPLDVDFTNTTGAHPDTVVFYWEIMGVGTNSENEQHTFTEPGTYTVYLTGTDPNGCSDRDSVLIVVDDSITVPNVFTPNGDGVNDIFKLDTKGLGEFTVQVYNRWGKLVYGPCTGAASACQWNGKHNNGSACADGTYYYVITGTDVNGNPIEQDDFTGHVTLLRQ